MLSFSANKPQHLTPRFSRYISPHMWIKCKDNEDVMRHSCVTQCILRDNRTSLNSIHSSSTETQSNFAQSLSRSLRFSDKSMWSCTNYDSNSCIFELFYRIFLTKIDAIEKKIDSLFEFSKQTNQNWNFHHIINSPQNDMHT